jgi:hypothetical protein
MTVGDTGRSTRRSGAVGARPGPAAAAATGSGSWIVTTFAVPAGIAIDCLHFGQGPVRPANWSLTVNRE